MAKLEVNSPSLSISTPITVLSSSEIANAVSKTLPQVVRACLSSTYPRTCRNRNTELTRTSSAVRKAGYSCLPLTNVFGVNCSSCNVRRQRKKRIESCLSQHLDATNRRSWDLRWCWTAHFQCQGHGLSTAPVCLSWLEYF